MKGQLVLIRPVRGIKLARLRITITMSREQRACPRLSGTRKQSGGNSTVLVRSHAKGGLVLVRPVRGTKQAGLRPSGTKSRETKACPRPSSTRNQAGGTSPDRYEVMQSEGLSSSVRYEKLSKRDFVRLVQSYGKGWLVRFCLARGIKQAGLRSSGTKSRMDNVSTSVQYDESRMQDFVRLE